MPMKPRKDESQSDFMHRCMSETFGADAPESRTQEQAVAICMSYWRDAHGGEKPKMAEEIARIIARWHQKFGKYPDLEMVFRFAADEYDTPDAADYDDQQEYMVDCLDQVLASDNVEDDEAELVCQNEWEDAHGSYTDEDWMRNDEEVLTKAMTIKHKTHVGEIAPGLEFILSDETIDRMGDMISSDGWDVKNFSKNPVCLFNHRADFVIGKWANLRVADRALRGNLQMAPKGTSARIDEIRKLIDADILKAVSVGFKPIESRPIKGQKATIDFIGEHYTKQELVECSLVAVPANPNALAVAKSLKISDATLDVVFAKYGNRNRQLVRRGVSGESAKTSRNGRSGAMSLAQRIKDAEGRIVALRDKLTEHYKTVDDSNITDAQLEISNELNAKIAQEEKGLAALREAERHLAASSQDDGGEDTGASSVPAVIARTNGTVRTTNSGGNGTTPARPFGLPQKKFDPIDLIIRDGIVKAFAHLNRTSVEESRQRLAALYPRYGDDVTKAYIEYSQRSAVNPAMTTVTGWAAELVQTIFSSMMETLMPKSIFPRLSGMGLSLSFGTAGKISIPTRSRTPTIAGSFVGEGQPIPVRQGAFTAQVLVPKKMGVITTYTREISEHSVPAIEGILRQAISEDTAVSLDSVLIDSNAATAVRPPGLLNGVAATTATAGGGFTALVGDIKALTGALVTSTQGHLRSPAWLMNPQQLNSAGLIPAPNSGVFPFRDEMSQGRLQGYPIIDSGTVPLGTVILVDAADFVVVGGDAPRFDVSDQATLHEEDTTPLPISGTPATVAAPVRSLFQTDSLALRLILPVNWALRRTGVVAWTQNVTW